MPKKQVIVGVVLGLIVLLGGWWMLGRGGDSSDSAANQRQRLSLPENVIDVADRPYLAIKPLADGRNIEIEVYDLKKEATELEYEVEYQSGVSSLQGFQGVLELTNLPASVTKLLGSCSAGGACSYHEDVKGGFFMGEFLGGDEPYALRSDWKYIDNADRDTAHSSKDAKFQIDGRTLAQQRYLVIFNSPGYPEDVPGEVVSEIYSLTSSGNLSGEAELTIRANEEGELQIAAWDGSEWTTYEGEVDGKMITATVDLAELYVVIR